ncbi:MAG: hypothetical protein NVS4B3_05090 [Gemmatimonadaceae bacterium]
MSWTPFFSVRESLARREGLRTLVGQASFHEGDQRTLALRSVALLLSVPWMWGAPARVSGQLETAQRPRSSEPVYLLIRSDDGGMSQSVNRALEKLVDTGLPVSVSVMFPCPWYQETVAMLKQHPAVSVGIHLTLNSEWKNYRWGPIAGRSVVPTLVDEDGYFYPTSAALQRNHPDLREVEIELRAQIARALASGLRIDYVDYHMGTAVRYPQFRQLTERLAREYGLGDVPVLRGQEI